jgi:excinuclease ABC subunit C
MFKLEAKSVPRVPGVYLFRDGSGKVLYIGKAIDLRARVRSYFNPEADGRPYIVRMMKRAASLETIVTDTEVEALILEANLIKNHRPQYNIDLKDDKSFPWVCVTHEQFPRVVITRKRSRHVSHCYGPFTSVRPLRAFLREFKGTLGIRNCVLALNEDDIKRGRFRDCLDLQIGKCQAPCTGKQTREDYNQQVQVLEQLLEGKGTLLVKTLRQDMEQASASQQYELAARYRDRLQVVESFMEKQKVEDAGTMTRDMVAIQREDNSACGVVLRVREGKLLGRFHSFLTGVLYHTEQEMMQAFLQQYYLDADQVPREILMNRDPVDRKLMEKWLSARREGPVKMRVPLRGKQHRLMLLAEKNAVHLINERLLAKQRKNMMAGSVEGLQRDLQLEKPPLRMETFDISHFGGHDTVASMVVFVGGKPVRSEYRSYIIKTVTGIDDFAAMGEVIQRRYSRLKREHASLPDLIVVDGGKGQLSRAVEVLQKLKLNIPVIGLAKRFEEVFVPGVSNPQQIPRSSYSIRLLQQIRDEAHRFAIRHNRERQRKRLTRSKLDSVPGIGPALQVQLLKHFGSVRRISQADVDALCGVAGIGRNKAETIHTYFARTKDAGTGS